MKHFCFPICFVVFLLCSSCGWNEPVDTTPIDLTAPAPVNDSTEPPPPPPPPAP